MILLSAGSWGCSVGQGSGSISGRLVATDCSLEEQPYVLEPSFFSGEVSSDQLNIRIQRGSNLEGYADGLMIQVLDVNELQATRLGIPIPITNLAGALVSVVVYLNETCLTGFPDEFRLVPLIMEGVSGEVTFDAIYAPDRDAARTGISGVISNLVFQDRDNPTGRNATLDGDFSFFYQRGGPAQRFP